MSKLAKPLLVTLCAVSLSACSLIDIINGGQGGSSSGDVVKQAFALYRTDTEEELHDGDSFEIETYYDFYFKAKYGNTIVNLKSITSSNSDVILAHSKSVYPRKEGNSTLTISYVAPNKQEYSYTLNVKSTYHNTLESIYVSGGETGIEFDGAGKPVVTGKVFARFENGVVRSISNDSNLHVLSNAGQDVNHKKVTLIYSKNGTSAQADYQVPLTTTGNPVEKTKLTQNYKTYSDNGTYKAYPYLNSSGNIRVLVLPIWFTDSNKYINESMKDNDGKTQKQQILEDFDNCLFGDPIRRNEQTLKSYYFDESFGNLNISGTVSDWYTSTYSSEVNYFTSQSSREALIQSAYDWYFNNHSDTKSSYDCVYVVYGSNHYGEESNAYGGFQTAMNNSSYPYLKRYVFASALGIYNIGNKQTEHLNIGDLSDMNGNNALYPSTAIHEFAHTMGAIDIYADSRKNGMKLCPAGAYTMQASDMGGHDVFNMLGFGWSSPYILMSDSDYGNPSIQLTIKDIQSSGDCIILSNSWNDFDSPFDEYLAIELFSECGVNTYDWTPNNRYGLRVYHVDTRLYYPSTGELTSDATKNKVILPFTNTAGYALGSNVYSAVSQYQDMDAVHLIRSKNADSKGNAIEYYTNDYGNVDMWFKAGDTFSMSKYAKQFYNEGKLDTNQDLKWSFVVNSINVDGDGSASATITFTKA